MWSYNVTKVVNRVGEKVAFLQLQGNASISEEWQNYLHIINVVVWWAQENDNVGNIYQEKFSFNFW